MKMRRSSAVAAAITVLATMALAEERPAAPAAPKTDEGAAQQYLERRGESLQQKMQDVMEPMKRGEGIRGATRQGNEEPGVQSPYSSSRRPR